MPRRLVGCNFREDFVLTTVVQIRGVRLVDRGDAREREGMRQIDELCCVGVRKADAAARR
jgi:hypothetical protein